jgi:hypothetical protein
MTHVVMFGGQFVNNLSYDTFWMAFFNVDAVSVLAISTPRYMQFLTRQKILEYNISEATSYLTTTY